MRLLAINLSANYVARILKVSKSSKEKGNTEKKRELMDLTVFGGEAKKLTLTICWQR